MLACPSAACGAVPRTFRPVGWVQTQELMNPLVRSEGHAARLHVVTTVIAARRYFLDGASKSEIAQELGISRFKVARLLDDARRDGIVRIEIGAPPEIDIEMSTELAGRYGLRGTLVQERATRPSLCRVAHADARGARRPRTVVGTDTPLDGRTPVEAAGLRGGSDRGQRPYA